MATFDPLALAREIGAIGLDTVSESFSDPLGKALADTAGGIAETERVKRFLVGILSSRTPEQLAHLQTAVRWGGRLAEAVLKPLVRRIMNKHHVPTGLAETVVDVIDDVCEVLGRRTEATLTPDQVTAYINSAVDTAVANPSTHMAARAVQGAHLTTINPTDRELSPEIVTEISVLSTLGFQRWGRLWHIRHESFWADPEQELDGSATIGEAIRALLAAKPRALHILERADAVEDALDVRNDEAIRAFLGAAEVFLLEPSFKATAHDEADRMMSGSARRAIKENAIAAGNIIKVNSLRVIKGMAWCALIGALLVIIGLLVSVWGIFATYNVQGEHDVSLGHVGVGAVVSLIGFGSIGISVMIWETGKAGIKWAYDTAGAPVGYLKAVVKAVARTFNINIETEAA